VSNISGEDRNIAWLCWRCVSVAIASRYRRRLCSDQKWGRYLERVAYQLYSGLAILNILLATKLIKPKADPRQTRVKPEQTAFVLTLTPSTAAGTTANPLHSRQSSNDRKIIIKPEVSLSWEEFWPQARHRSAECLTWRWCGQPLRVFGAGTCWPSRLLL